MRLLGSFEQALRATGRWMLLRFGPTIGRGFGLLVSLGLSASLLLVACDRPTSVNLDAFGLAHVTITLVGSQSVGGASSSLAPQGVPFDPGTGLTGVTHLVLTVSRSGLPLYFDASGNELPSSDGAEPIVISGGSVTLRLLPGWYEFTVTGSDGAGNVLADGDSGELEVMGHTTLPITLRSFLGSVSLQAPTVIVPNQVVDVRVSVHPPGRTDLNVPTSDYTITYITDAPSYTTSPLGVRLQAGCQPMSLTADVTDKRSSASTVSISRQFTLSDVCSPEDTTVTVDVTPPTLTLDATPTAFRVGELITLTGTVTDDRDTTGVTVTIHDGPAYLGDAAIDTTPLPHDWWFSFTPDQERAYHLTITATDAAGNQATAHLILDAMGPVQAGQFVQLATGQSFACGLTRAGHAYCWGLNDRGQLGDGTTADRSVPTAVAGGHTFSSIVGGSKHTCGITTQGEAFCWGKNDSGELGTGNRSYLPNPTPSQVIGNHAFTHLAAGADHTCGLTSTGAALCWGNNYQGQLGNEIDEISVVPVDVLGDHSFTAIAAGYQHTCAIDSMGATRCWGVGMFGRLGNGDTADEFSPVLVEGTNEFTNLGLGGAHSCGVTSSGAGYCWGWDSYGQLGAASPGTSSPLPVQGDHDLAKIASKALHTCAVTINNEALCWGRNGSGELGTGDTSTLRGAPTPVAGDLSFVDIAPGQEFTCAIATDGNTYCWGTNAGGQLGDGTTDNHWVPLPIVNPVEP